jgi:hypothetical protein
MDCYDEKQLEIFRKEMTNAIARCDKTMAEWKEKPGETEQQRRHMVSTYEAKKTEIVWLLETYDEMFGQYLDLEKEDKAA